MSKEEEQSSRDTQFASFALALARELTEVHVFYETTGIGQLILARRAYDLVSHTLLNVDQYWLDTLSLEECTQKIPDMAELPKKEREA